MIDWCNANSSFVSAILSAVGIILSCAAVFISVHTARLPYKKDLMLYVKKLYRDGETLDAFEVGAVNTGNREVFVEYLSLVEGKGNEPKELLEFWLSSDDLNYIRSGEKFTKRYSASFYKEVLNRVTNFDKVFICAKDSEGKRYFQKLKIDKDLEIS